MVLGFFAVGVWAPEHAGSVIAVSGLICPMACGVLVPWPGIEPTFPALEGRFVTTGPPGKSSPFLSLFLWFSCHFSPELCSHICLLLFSTISFLCSYNLALAPCFIKEIVSLFYLHSWWNIWWPFLFCGIIFFFFFGECSLYLLLSFYLDGIFVQILYLFLHRLQAFLGPVIFRRFELGRCQGHVPGQLAFPHNLVFSVSVFASPQPVEMAVGSPLSASRTHLCLISFGSLFLYLEAWVFVDI